MRTSVAELPFFWAAPELQFPGPDPGPLAKSAPESDTCLFVR